MKTKGRLLYLNWDSPWILFTEDERIDLRPTVEKFLASINMKRASQRDTRNVYELYVDGKSEFEFRYVKGEYAYLVEVTDFDGFNVQAHLKYILRFLSGRVINVEIIDSAIIILSADETVLPDNICILKTRKESSTVSRHRYGVVPESGAKLLAFPYK